MLQRIVDFALDNRWLVPAGMLGLLVGGGYVLLNLPIDAFPDLTNNQVVVVTESPSMSSTEVDELVTYPIELRGLFSGRLANIELHAARSHRAFVDEARSDPPMIATALSGY